MQIWAESGKSALPICNYSQILYQFLTFTQNLKRSLAILQTRRSSSVHWIFWLKNCWLVNIHLNQTVPSEPADKKFLFLLVFILSLKNGRKFFRYSIGKIILMSCSTKFFLHRKSQQVKDFTHWLFYINGYLNQENRALLQHINRHCFVFDIQPVRS